MIAYDPNKPSHEMMALKWFLDLRAKPDEFNKLFTKSLQNLTIFLHWIRNTVRVAVAFDEQGFWACAWIEPSLSGAYAGAWIREGKRGTFQALAFMNRFYAESLRVFPVLLGLTKQRELHEIHLAMGYTLGCVIPEFFDGDDAFLYIMTRESRREARHNVRARRQIHIKQQQQQPIRTSVDESVSIGEANSERAVIADGGGPAHRRSKLPKPNHRRKSRRGARGLQHQPANP